MHATYLFQLQKLFLLSHENLLIGYLFSFPVCQTFSYLTWTMHHFKTLSVQWRTTWHFWIAIMKWSAIKYRPVERRDLVWAELMNDSACVTLLHPSGWVLVTLDYRVDKPVVNIYIYIYKFIYMIWRRSFYDIFVCDFWSFVIKSDDLVTKRSSYLTQW